MIVIYYTVLFYECFNDDKVAELLHLTTKYYMGYINNVNDNRVEFNAINS